MATTKDTAVKIPVSVGGASTLTKKEGDGKRYGLSWRLKSNESTKEIAGWLFHAENSGRQVKLARQGDPEGVIGTLSTVTGKNGELRCNFVLLPCTTSQFEYLWDAVNGEDELIVSAAQGIVASRQLGDT